MGFLKELWVFIRVRKKYWLIPIIVCLLMFGAVMILSSGSSIAPFVYTVF